MIVLDTCAIVWDALDPGRLTSRAKTTIDAADQHGTLIISDISIWEIAMLISRSRLKINSGAANFVNLYLQTRSITVVAISPAIAEMSAGFGSTMNGDPADRIIAATTVVHKASLVTADADLRKSALLSTVW